jgi:hypothetical protein
MAPTKLKVALAGLGRIGKKHAINLLNFAPRVDFVAAFTPAQAELAWGREHLEPYGVLLYDDYELMMSHPGLQAVAIATAAEVHAEEVFLALEHDLHVFCEKPLSTSIESVCSLEHPPSLVSDSVAARYLPEPCLTWSNCTVSRHHSSCSRETTIKSDVRVFATL